MTPAELKQAAARAALDYVPAGCILGVGTGSTTNFFIAELPGIRDRIKGAVSSSEASARRLTAVGVRVLDLNDVETMPVYIDGADEVTPAFDMLKGGGGAMTREKIVAAVAEKFVCIVDDAKLVDVLGAFPLPVEVIPMARQHVARQLIRLGGTPKQRPYFVTDNGNHILDVRWPEKIHNPRELEIEINQIAGVVTSGLFAQRGADIVLVGTPSGVKTLLRPGT
jgi:ribose 5-phosphate isomerase A